MYKGLPYHGTCNTSDEAIVMFIFGITAPPFLGIECEMDTILEGEGSPEDQEDDWIQDRG